MSRRIGNLVVIEAEEDDECELCGAWDELRPYGPGGKRICFSCAQKDLAAVNRMMDKVLFGDGEIH